MSDIDYTQFDGHTPGPWQVERMWHSGRTVAIMRDWPLHDDPSGPALAVHAETEWIAGGPKMTNANARLIAAAPALLARCRELEKQVCELTARLEVCEREIEGRTKKLLAAMAKVREQEQELEDRRAEHLREVK